MIGQRPKSGQILDGRYKIVDFLGSGGFGETYLAQDTRCHNQNCVVKKLTPQSTDPCTLQIAKDLFDEEAKVLHSLGNHPQIPQLYAHFKENQEFYLVQEFIEGHDLSHEITLGTKLSEEFVTQLLQDILEVLVFVHEKKKIHRDIKPSNLIRRRQDNKIVLIDFGAVKQVTTLISTSQGQVSSTVAVGTPGYMPSEQAQGRPRFSSDIYAVGMTAIQALTGVMPKDFPEDFNGEVIWRNQVQISDRLANILTKMMRCHFGERYFSAAEALTALSPTVAVSTQPPPLPPLPPRLYQLLVVFGFPIILLVGVGIGWIWKPLQPQKVVSTSPPSPTCDSVLDDHLSCGEESLFPDNLIQPKQLGIEEYKNGNYKLAIKLLEQARKQQPSDPETLIYLNNTRLAEQKTETYTIAVVAPTRNKLQPAIEVLRGVAQAQDEINRQKINGKGLRVLIADDDNDSKQAAIVAKELVKKTNLLGVIGHYASERTLEVLDIYQKHNLVLISYGSTSTELSSYGLIPGHIFFRTVPTTEVTALSLTSYLINQIPQQKVGVFYNPKSAFSRSMRDRFQISINATGGKIIQEFDLCQINLNEGKALAAVQRKGVTAIALFPDGRVCNLSYQNVLNIIAANNKRYSMVASWSVSSSETLKRVGQYASEKLVVFVPWHRLSSTNLEFLKTAENLWGKSELLDNGVDGVTATAYDATRVFITALKKLSQPHSRVDVQKILASPNFTATGATGTISFMGGDRKEPINVLLKVVPSKCSSSGYTFVPINYINNQQDCT